MKVPTINAKQLFDEQGRCVLFYNMDNNQFETYYGDVIYNLWDFFYPSQLSLFKQQHIPSKKIRTKQGWKVEITKI